MGLTVICWDFAKESVKYALVKLSGIMDRLLLPHVTWRSSQGFLCK